jgi:hypothetical protein
MTKATTFEFSSPNMMNLAGFSEAIFPQERCGHGSRLDITRSVELAKLAGASPHAPQH